MYRRRSKPPVLLSCPAPNAKSSLTNWPSRSRNSINCVTASSHSSGQLRLARQPCDRSRRPSARLSAASPPSTVTDTPNTAQAAALRSLPSEVTLAAVCLELGFRGFECAARGLDIAEQGVMTVVRIHLLCLPQCPEGVCVSPAESHVPFDEAHTGFTQDLACHAQDTARLTPF